MRMNDVGLFNSFEEVERCELRQLDSAFVDEMTDAFTSPFLEDSISDGMLASAAWDD
jgi:hypothetical protein